MSTRGRRERRRERSALWYADFADRLRRYWTQTGLSQKEFGERLGVSESTISNWLSGKQAPDLHRLVAIATVLGVSTDELLQMASSELRERIEAARKAREELDQALRKAEEGQQP